ncbi:hypothetical protein CAEBREN_20418 [Caenorhabditis brenneri]|uniref:Fibrinogen C-terminal domain-containing protein n=1 Tax=Caenorhabditis brenneri TaxID=135651 RepID=G0P925_CAEBE|nr:hypothetical protein CAEBREN_20418 [Caenorhabditis brenneri]
MNGDIKNEIVLGGKFKITEKISGKVDTKANLYKLTATADLPGIGLDYTSTAKDIGAPFSTQATYSLPKSKVECDQFEFYDDENSGAGPSKGYGGWWYGSCGNNLNGFLYPSDNADCTVKVECDQFEFYDDENSGAGPSKGYG